MNDTQDAWKKQLLLGGQGGPENCVSNVYLILTHAPELKGALQYNTITQRAEVARELPWKRSGEVLPRAWTKNDTTHLRILLETRHGMLGVYLANVQAAVEATAAEQPVTPERQDGVL